MTTKSNEFHIGHGFGGFSTECPVCAASMDPEMGLRDEIARLRTALARHHRGLTMAGDDDDKCAVCAKP